MQKHFIFAFIFSIGIVYGQNKKIAEQKDSTTFSKSLEEVIITGQITNKSTENSVHKIHVISGKKLKTGLYTDLGQILEKELNIRLNQDNVLGSSISLQGLSGQNIKILIDDIPIIGRMNGNIDLSQISLNNIERIEIIEGPLSTIYGTDAIAGTINIITNKKTEDKNKLTTYYETIGKYNFDFFLTKKIKNKQLSYIFERRYFNGWSEGQKFNIIPVEEIANNNRVKEWKPKEQFVQKVQLYTNKNNNTTYSYIENFLEKITNKGLPRGPYFENAFDEYFYTTRTNFGTNISLKHNNDKINIIAAYNKYNRTKETYYKDLTNLSSVLVQDPNSQDTSVFNSIIAKAIISNNYLKKLQYQLGLSFISELGQGKRLLNKEQTQSDYALFATFEYQPHKIFTLRPSARIIHNTSYKAPFVPAINTLITFQNFKIRSGVAKGFRAPSLKELYLDFVDINHNIIGNQNLSAETSLNYYFSGSYAYKSPAVAIKTDYNFFYNEINNKIELARSTIISDQYTYFNIDQYKTKGISGNINILKGNTDLSIGLSHIGRYNKLSESNNLKEFNFSTDYNASAIINIGNKNKLNLYYKYFGKLPSFEVQGQMITETYINSYQLLDLSFNRKINNTIITVGGKNLLNISQIKTLSEVSETTPHTSSENNRSISYGRTLFLQLNLYL